jgi:hypothetical protein
MPWHVRRNTSDINPNRACHAPLTGSFGMGGAPISATERPAGRSTPRFTPCGTQRFTERDD